MARSSSRFSRIKKPLKSDMNVVPYIDVMLVLLVIFMVTAPMITSSVNVDLPKSHQQNMGSSNAPDIYTVTIDAQGKFTLEHNFKNKQTLALDEIQNILIQAYQNDSEINVMIAGDQKIAYGKVMQLMSELQQAGLKQVGLVTQPLK